MDLMHVHAQNTAQHNFGLFAAGWLASQQKVPPSPGLIITSIIIIVMIVKLLIISSISTISFIHICNMNDINNNIVRTYHNDGAIMINP